MKTIALYAGAIAGLWTLLSITFAAGFLVGRGLRSQDGAIALEDVTDEKSDSERLTSTQELAVAQFSKAAWLSRPQM